MPVSFSTLHSLHYCSRVLRAVNTAFTVLEEIAAHVRAALEWTRMNRDLNPANAILIYAWNEHDEGGWLQPTLGPDGRPDEGRIKAVGKVLRSAASSKP